MPTGAARRHHRRFDEQSRGETTYLVAWDDDGVPFGTCEIVWREDVPAVQALQVWPPERRGGGTGTALMAEAERLARERGATHVKLAVGVDNHEARRLYERLGYVSWGGGTFRVTWAAELPDGTVGEDGEDADLFFKEL